MRSLSNQPESTSAMRCLTVLAAVDPAPTPDTSAWYPARLRPRAIGEDGLHRVDRQFPEGYRLLCRAGIRRATPLWGDCWTSPIGPEALDPRLRRWHRRAARGGGNVAGKPSPPCRQGPIPFQQSASLIGCAQCVTSFRNARELPAIRAVVDITSGNLLAQSLLKSNGIARSMARNIVIEVGEDRLSVAVASGEPTRPLVQ